MTDRLEAAARPYREARAEEDSALQAVKEAQARRKLAADKVRKARAPLAEAIVEAAKAGRRQVEIVAVTGYTREQVRRICRAAGVEPAE